MGLPMGLQYSVTAIGSILLQTAVNGLGSVAMAAVTASGKVINLFACPYDAMGTTAATYAGQNLGAGKLDRVNTGVKDCAILGTLYALVALAAMYFGERPCPDCFWIPRTWILRRRSCPWHWELLVVNAAFYTALMGVNLFRFTIQGLGYSNLAVIAGVFEMIARGGVALGLVPVLGFTAVCYASRRPGSWRTCSWCPATSIA